jgi:CRISPR-associated protein Cas2
MDLLITYDVNTLTKEGRARLRRVAKICQGYGQRVQFSVFECSVNDAQHEILRSRLLKTIHRHEDSLRIYTLRGFRDQYIESHGRDSYIDFHDALIV